MLNLHQELATLARCVKYQNLSQAAAHVGLSQPQLSRVISKIERELDLTLLDRTARRKSAWTPMAFKISQVYSGGIEKLENEINVLLESSTISHLRVGTLEGMIPVATKVIETLFQKTEIQSADIQVLDLSELELSFARNDFDIVFTHREPGRRKFDKQKLLGYQTLDNVQKSDAYDVYSSFEYSSLNPRQKKKINRPVVVSNSLLFRKHWIESIGGKGLLPSEISSKKPSRKDVENVYLIGADSLPSKIWNAINTFLI